MMVSKKIVVTVLIFFVLLGAGGALITGSGMYLYLSPQLPSTESLRDIQLQTPLRIYSRDAKLIGVFGEQLRTPIKFQEIPQNYLNALLAAEDSNFFSHKGVSIKGLLRAVSELLITGKKGSGGSTLTMQVARNVFLTRKRTFVRKFNEILLALRIERELSKEEILEIYVNKVFHGKRAYGIAAAAQVYYGKDISELSLAQHAMVAGLPQGPSTQNPIVNPTRAVDRRNWILSRMFELNMIDDATYQDAIAEVDNAQIHGHALDLDAPYISEMARKFSMELFGSDATTAGYRVYTTVDSRMQAKAEAAVIEGLLDYDKRHGYRGPEQKVPDELLLPYLNLAALNEDNSEKNMEALESGGEEQEVNEAADGTDPGLKDSNEENKITVLHETLEPWLGFLKEIPSYSGLHAAAVIKVGEQSVEALLGDGSTVDITWEQGLSDARPYINENQRGPAPEKASDVLAVGDVVRVRQRITGKIELVQLPEVQGALVSLQPNDGAILSLVGGFNFAQSHFNRVTQAERQPGSNFKPFIYVAALESGFTPATIVNDAPEVFEDELLEAAWRPQNDSGKFYGPTRLRKALYLSRNLVSIRVMQSMGIQETINTLGRFGFNTDELPRDLSLALGSHSLTPMEIVSAYAVLANGGYKVEPYFISHIEDYEGRRVYQSLPARVCRECELEDSDEASQAPSDLLAELVEENALRIEAADDDGDRLVAESDQAAEAASVDAASPLNETDDGEGSEALSPMEQEYLSFVEIMGDIFALKTEEKVLLDMIEDSDYPRAPKILSDQVAYIINSMLRDVIKRGTGVKARVLGRNDLAGKTGTTDEYTNAWFSGYNHDVVTTTWVGFDQYKPLGRSEYGGKAALPIWINYMGTALKDSPETTRPQPPGIVAVKIDPETGNRARFGDPDAIFEIFRTENVPPLVSEDVENPYATEESITEEIF